MEAPPSDIWERVELHGSGVSGVAHVPRPVEPGDVAALECGPVLRIVSVTVDEHGAVSAQVERVRLALSG